MEEGKKLLLCSRNITKVKPDQGEVVLRGKILNICQGEVGHALSSQCDIIASHEATTCHIVALRSVSKAKQPICSLAHIDKPQYEGCIRQMVYQHKLHHSENGEIQMDLHIMGGYDDSNFSSVRISEFLLRLFAQIALEEQSHIKLTLQTCLVSCLNDDGNHTPIGRGLGINISSGKVFLSRLHSSALGPEIDLRRCRIFSSLPSTLSLVHNTTDCPNHFQMSIQPFSCQINTQSINELLRMPDSLLLHYTSTSPEVEDEDFCIRTRRILKYLVILSCDQTFGKYCDMPLRFQYAVITNGKTWNPICSQ